MGKTIVGVDIGSESLRAVEVEGGRGARPTVVRFHELPLPEGAVRNGEVVEVNTVAAVLKQLWSLGGFKSKKVVLGVGNSKVLVRELTVPKLGKREIRAALPFQVQDMLPVPVADAILDFYPISEGHAESGPTVTGLLVAAVKESVMSNVTAVLLAGLNPVEVDLIPFALNRVLLRGQHAEGTVALIDIGMSTTNVVITVDGVPQFVRIIPAGGADVTRAMTTRLGLAPEDAEAEKRNLGLRPATLGHDNREAVDVIQETSRDLLNSLRNTLSFFVNSRQGQHIDRVLLSGGGSLLGSFSTTLADLTRIPVFSERPFDTVALGKAAARSQSLKDSSNMTVALGLALGSAA